MPGVIWTFCWLLWHLPTFFLKFENFRFVRARPGIASVVDLEKAAESSEFFWLQADSRSTAGLPGLASYQRQAFTVSL